MAFGLLSIARHQGGPERTGTLMNWKFNNLSPSHMENTSSSSQSKGNLEIYNQVRSVPEHALKKIEAGRLKGKSDINPMFRIQKLTEVFGPVGFGWYTEVTRKWTETSENGEQAVFVDLNLYVRRDGEWSRPIHGTGGNKLVTLERKWENGEMTVTPYLDDEAYKKAYTDAISVAAKALGVGADVYWEADKTKYDVKPQEETPAAAAAPQAQPSGKPSLSPATSSWKQAVAFCAKQNDTEENLRSRVSSKYNISEANLDLLLRQAGKLSK